MVYRNNFDTKDWAKLKANGDARRVPDLLGGRVAPGRCLPGAPTDPDVQISRIRLFETRLRYATRTADGCRSG
jgi:hypothetical protein